MSRLRFLAVIGVCLALSQCAPAPKPPAVVTLVLAGSSGQYADAGGTASPVAVRVFQLTSTAKFERADVFALIDREQQTLGADSAGSQEVVLSPSENRTMTIEAKPGVTAIGVVALYREVDHAQWRADAPVNGSGPTKLKAEVGPLAITLKPG